jgi:5-methylcytosine-specific restriction endonuclease McrA
MILCIKCNIEKSPAEFYESRLSNYSYVCKECEKEQSKRFQSEYRKRDEVVSRNREYQKEYRTTEEFRKSNSEYQKKYRTKKISTDATFRLERNMASHIYHALMGNKYKKQWPKCVGYTLPQLQERLECGFAEGMSWSNYGEWHVDHIVPKSKFKYASYEDDAFKQCWSLDNLQPLWAKENLAKGNRTVA